MRKFAFLLALPILSLLLTGQSYGWYVKGNVYCDVSNFGMIDPSDTPLANVKISVSGPNFNQQTMTDSNGYYIIWLSGDPKSYNLTIGPDGLPPDAAQIIPGSNPYPFATTAVDFHILVNALISSRTCRTGACWLTAGGVKFDPVLGIQAAEHGPKFSFGGNTFPGCNPTSGDGGQWNFVDHARKLHFQGWSVTDVTCGNVIGIEPGSTSPRTPFNYIEFSGVGTVKGIASNKVSYEPVYFFVRAEDRNEPGNEKALLPDGGVLVDRLFLNVYTDPSADPVTPGSSTIYSLGTYPAPLTITGGNIQIHISSCE